MAHGGWEGGAGAASEAVEGAVVEVFLAQQEGAGAGGAEGVEPARHGVFPGAAEGVAVADR